LSAVSNHEAMSCAWCERGVAAHAAVMRALVARIHVLTAWAVTEDVKKGSKAWIAGSSPAMTECMEHVRSNLRVITGLDLKSDVSDLSLYEERARTSRALW
jgi:hypothetical protein